MFFNEQAFRGALKGMEGISNENATALMMSFNRLGVVWSSASTALTTSGDTIRNEWGFKGMIETDGVAGGSCKSSHSRHHWQQA